MQRISFLAKALVIGLLAVLAACEKNVTIDIPQRAPRLVLDGQLGKGQPFQISVGKSRGILQPLNYNLSLEDNYVVKDARPIVFENNTPIDTLVFSPSDYRYKTIRNKIVRDGFTYTLKVTAPNFEQAEATTIVPSQSQIASVTRVANARKNADGNFMDQITIKLNDPSEVNHYQISFFAAANFGGTGYPITCLSSTDKDLESIGDNTDPTATDNCFDGSQLLMKDVNFNGGTKVLTVYIESSQLMNNSSGGMIHRPFVKVYRITADHFKYIKSLNTFENTAGNPFAEPVNVYSNISNGYGLFSAYTMAVDTLR
jgi:hypothetical protein